MSYATIHQCANDAEFQGRVTSACAQENTPPEPYSAMYNNRYDIAAKSDIEAAYASALAAGNPHPGGDEAVITDGMILSAVQSLPPG
jgi:hypothetical protein